MKNIAIVGLGVIGGSFAKAIQAKFPNQYHVMGIDVKQDTLNKALQQSVIAEGETSNQSLLQKADFVIISLYPTQIKQYLLDYQDDFKQGAIVTDTAGIKQTLMEDILPILPEHIDFIFGHPMAGRESQGYDYADESVFQNANYIITPHDRNKAENLTCFTDFLKSIGFVRITTVSSRKHDEMIAYTSQLCHLIATSLINSSPSLENITPFTGNSFRELTRIAKMNEKMWSELILNNQESLLEVIKSFEDSFNLLKTAIINNDKEKLETEFIESTHRRIQFEEEDTVLNRRTLN